MSPDSGYTHAQGLCLSKYLVGLFHQPFFWVRSVVQIDGSRAGSFAVAGEPPAKGSFLQTLWRRSGAAYEVMTGFPVSIHHLL